MTHDLSTTAILLFSRTAAEEAAVKTFDARLGRKGNRRLARHLIRQSRQTARRTGLPVFTSFSTQQTGHSFGERLANAVESVWAKGYSQLIVIGNDCPSLTPQLLRRTAAQLQHMPLVLGPAYDGGVYLIGLQQAAYQREDFLALAWETPHLQTTWQTAAHPIAWLAPYRDIDHATDLQAFLHNRDRNTRLLRQQLRVLLYRSAPVAVGSPAAPSATLLAADNPHRGPPR